MPSPRRIYDTVAWCLGNGYIVVAVVLTLALICSGGLGIAHAQVVSPSANTDDRDTRSITDPCHDPTVNQALKEALQLACARQRISPESHCIRNAIILGFVGGFVKQDDAKHPEVGFAKYLQIRYGFAVRAEIFGNHAGKRAVKETILRLDTNKDGLLTTAEKEHVKIILYGHSWGASETLAVARELQQNGIPVALTIQIDSIKKLGQDDRNVPANVEKAVNFYQRKGLTRGQPRIVAADAQRTKILGNFHMHYRDHQVNCDNYRWSSRVLNRPHHQIENDPQVWGQIASLIDSELLGN